MIKEGLTLGTTTALTRKVVAEWIDAVLTELRNETTIIKNAWMKSGYKWFDWVGYLISSNIKIMIIFIILCFHIYYLLTSAHPTFTPT